MIKIIPPWRVRGGRWSRSRRAGALSARRAAPCHMSCSLPGRGRCALYSWRCAWRDRMGLDVIAGCKMVEDIWGFGPEQNLEDVAYSQLWKEVFSSSEVLGRDLISVRRVRSHLSLGQARRQGV
eukprot:6478678-Pyramimonas_sp.AAC.1